jgi:hypothetical protein
MRSPKFLRRLLSLLLGGGLAVVLIACGSPAGSGTTTSSGTSPTAIQPTTVRTATTSPTQVVTPPVKLTVAIACGGTKQNGYGVDVIHGKVCAQTLAKAILSIQVTYCNGKPDPTPALQGTVIANANGFYEWNWTPEPDCKGQPIWAWKVTVLAQFNGQTATESNQGMA